jgi:thiol-disulfide isomerase/thioredoxin
MKNKLTILTALLLFTYLTGFTQNRSITFIEKPWSEILTQAKTQDKLIFLDGYTTWCGPCKWMAANMFKNDTIADYYNKTFVCAHFDMEKGEGITLARTYQVMAYPTLLFINAAGEMVHKRVGAPQRVQDYLDMGRIALTPGEGFNAYVKKFQEGNRDPKFIMQYLERLQGAYIPIAEPLKEYFASQKDADLLNRANWQIIYQYVSDMDSREFVFMLKHQKEYEKQYTKDSVSSKIFSVYLQSLSGIARSRTFSETNYNLVKQKIRDSGYDGAEKVIFTADLGTYAGDKFFELAYSGIDKWYANDYETLGRISKVFFMNTEDPEYLKKAAEWAKKSISLKSNADNNDTYASLMFKLGNKAEAVKYEKIALELAIKENIVVKTYEENLRKFQE